MVTQRLRLCRDAALHAQLERYGYAVIDFLDAHAVAAMRESAIAYAAQFGSGFHSSIFSSDDEYREASSAIVREATHRGVEERFADTTSIFSGFLVKQPTNRSFVGFHQDWTFVDEDRCDTFTVWIPLQDVDERNGCLMLVPGSHLLNCGLRGFGTDFPYNELIPSLLHSHTVSVPVRAGQAVVFSPRIFHASNPNWSEEPRYCANVVVVPRQAPLYYHHQREHSGTPVLERFNVEPDYYERAFRWGITPDSSRSAGFMDAAFDEITQSDISRLPSIAH